MSLQFAVWNEVGTALGDYNTKSKAEGIAHQEREECAKICGESSDECGVLHPHEIFIQILEDGEDVSINDSGNIDDPTHSRIKEYCDHRSVGRRKVELYDWEQKLLSGAVEYKTRVKGFVVLVSKDDGGTVGDRYAGTWTVTVINGTVFILDNAYLYTNTPKTHEEVAKLALTRAWEQMDG